MNIWTSKTFLGAMAAVVVSLFLIWSNVGFAGTVPTDEAPVTDCASPEFNEMSAATVGITLEQRFEGEDLVAFRKVLSDKNFVKMQDSATWTTVDVYAESSDEETYVVVIYEKGCQTQFFPVSRQLQDELYELAIGQEVKN